MKYFDEQQFCSNDEFINRLYKLEKEYVYSDSEREIGEYLNAPAALDTENTTVYYNKDTQEIIAGNVYAEKLKVAKQKVEKAKNKTKKKKALANLERLHTEYHPAGIGYIWMFGICGICTYGRTYEELQVLLAKVEKWLNGTILAVYVHNLGYDFQFIEPYIDIKNIFCLDTRSPARIRTEGGLEFRDSLCLTGLSLEFIGKKKLQKYKVQKAVGNLDYNKIRHPKTPMTEAEMKYCINDIKVVMAYIQEILESGDDDIATIPMTKTGYVRRDCRNQLLCNPEYMNKISQLTIQTTQELELLICAFRGGFTHANWMLSGLLLHNVASYDEVSCYPAMMLTRYFPSSKGKTICVEALKPGQFTKLLNTKCCLISVHFDHIERKEGMADSYISLNREMKNVLEDNGRIISADNVNLVITEIDWQIINKCYDVTLGDEWLRKMIVYDRDLLPVEFRKIIIQYYQQKTTLKGIKGREVEYAYYKELLNSLYGMMVQKPFKEFDDYNTETHTWDKKTKKNMWRVLYNYNNSKKRFTFFPVGLWVTSHARANVWDAICKIGNDYIYSDTDSVKILNAEKHKQYFEEYNKRMIEQLKSLYTEDEYAPKANDGTRKPIGIWGYEGTYDEFKTLGAKKYLTRTGDEYQLTVAGVNKKTGTLHFKSADSPFEEFQEGTTLEYEDCGRLLHTYIDDPVTLTITDYTGQEMTVTQKKGIALTPSTYKIGLSQKYHDLLLGIGNI